MPTPFLERLASALNSTVESLKDALALPPTPKLAQSYKADDRPEVREPVTFEQILIEADVPPDPRALLMTTENQDG
ncbi:hypothetical protein [Altericista sp. CCNU0014]|uniref:hypothetical protein n=1 Tax=Altericista sp. CCNU0014 TaxID=3082949 RepID=UPI00384C5CE3